MTGLTSQTGSSTMWSHDPYLRGNKAPPTKCRRGRDRELLLRRDANGSGFLFRSSVAFAFVHQYALRPKDLTVMRSEDACLLYGLHWAPLACAFAFSKRGVGDERRLAYFGTISRYERACPCLECHAFDSPEKFFLHESLQFCPGADFSYLIRTMLTPSSDRSPDQRRGGNPRLQRKGAQKTCITVFSRDRLRKILSSSLIDRRNHHHLLTCLLQSLAHACKALVQVVTVRGGSLC